MKIYLLLHDEIIIEKYFWYFFLYVIKLNFNEKSRYVNGIMLLCYFILFQLFGPHLKHDGIIAYRCICIHMLYIYILYIHMYIH